MLWRNTIKMKDHTEGIWSMSGSFSWSIIQLTAAARLSLPEAWKKIMHKILNSMKNGNNPSLKGMWRLYFILTRAHKSWTIGSSNLWGLWAWWFPIMKCIHQHLMLSLGPGYCTFEKYGIPIKCNNSTQQRVNPY